MYGTLTTFYFEYTQTKGITFRYWPTTNTHVQEKEWIYLRLCGSSLTSRYRCSMSQVLARVLFDLKVKLKEAFSSVHLRRLLSVSVITFPCNLFAWCACWLCVGHVIHENTIFFGEFFQVFRHFSGYVKCTVNWCCRRVFVFYQRIIDEPKWNIDLCIRINPTFIFRWVFFIILLFFYSTFDFDFFVFSFTTCWLNCYKVKDQFSKLLWFIFWC